VKKLNLLLAITILSITIPLKVNAYDPTNSGIKYSELQDYLYINDSSIKTVPAEVQEAWDDLGSVTRLFEKERTTIYYTSGVALKERVTDDGVYFDAKYINAQTATHVGKSGSYGYAERPGRIYVYSDVRDSETIIHEYGHALYDIYLYRIGYKNKFMDKWLEIYDSNKKSLSKIDKSTKENVLVNEYEGFAEAFRLYIVAPEVLSKSNRRVYSFMDSIVTEACRFNYSR
jgi:hypothetical protein